MAEVKETEKLPEGWKRVKLGEIAELSVGSSKSKYVIEHGSYAIVDMGAISSEGKLITNKRTDFQDDLLEYGDLVMPKDDIGGGKIIGKVAFIDNNNKYILGDHVFRIKIREGYSKYFYYFINSKLFNTKIKCITTGTAQLGIKEKEVKELELMFPISLPEQQKIAEILETVDNAIEKTDKIIEKYKRIKQGLMEDLLTKGIDENGNIRSEKTHKFKDSPLGRIPEEWEVVKLGGIAKVESGFGFPIKYQGNDSGLYPFIKVDDLNKTTKYTISANNYIDLNTLYTLRAKIFPPGTIIFPKIGIALYHNKYRILKTLGTFDNNIAGIIPINHSSEFLYYYFSWKVDLKQIAGETAVPSVCNSNLELIPVTIPPLPEQHRIAEILSQIDQAIEKEQKYKEKLQRIKQGLMEDLLTGKVRVNHLIEEVKNVPQT